MSHLYQDYIYCAFCNLMIDPDHEGEHFAYPFTCYREIGMQFRNEKRWNEIFKAPADWESQARWGDTINKEVKERSPQTHYKQDNGRGHWSYK